MRSRWVVDLLFAPVSVAIWWVSAFLLTLADGDQDRSPDERGLGLLLLPAVLILLAALIHYYAKLALRLFKTAPRQ